jgi:hypothetical protein
MGSWDGFLSSRRMALKASSSRKLGSNAGNRKNQKLAIKKQKRMTGNQRPQPKQLQTED